MRAVHVATISETDFLTALYRGILNREPDALGLAGHAAELQAEPLPRAMVTAIRGFLGSEEYRAKQGAADLLEQLRPHIVPQPPFEHVISLGSHCYTSWILKQDHLKRFSLPFDWIFSNLSMVMHCIKDDFRLFLDPAQYAVRPESSRPRPNEGLCDHLFYRDRFGVELVFNHYDPTNPADWAYFNRAVARFRAVLASPQRKLFLAISTDDRITPTDFPALATLIDQITTNAELLVIRILPPSHDDRIFGVSPLDRRGRHTLLAYQPTSPLTGLGFQQPFDDLMIRRQLRGLPFAPAAPPVASM